MILSHGARCEEWNGIQTLAVYFLHHRELLGGLSQAAAQTAKELLAVAAGGEEAGRARESGSRCRM